WRLDEGATWNLLVTSPRETAVARAGLCGADRDSGCGKSRAGNGTRNRKGVSCRGIVGATRAGCPARDGFRLGAPDKLIGAGAQARTGRSRVRIRRGHKLAGRTRARRSWISAVRACVGVRA